MTRTIMPSGSSVYHGDAIEFFKAFKYRSVQLVWTDPPFGTGKAQSHHSTWTGTDRLSYMDYDEAAALDLVVKVSEQVQRVLTNDGVFALLLDYRIVHEAVVELKRLGFHFHQEIIWHFELGGVSRKWWTNKHHTIALFSTEGTPRFKLDRVPTTIRRAPRGEHTSSTRRVNSVWSLTMGPSNPERTGYPNQKPLSIIEPFIDVHTDPADIVVDPFAGSGSVAHAAHNLGREWHVCDSNPMAIETILNRMHPLEDEKDDL